YANWLDTGDIKEHYLKYNHEEAKGNLLPADYDDDLMERSSSYYETGLMNFIPEYHRPKAQPHQKQITNPAFPLIAMVISGGHTQIISMTAHNSFEIIGTTRDDAIGECFDKVAKIIGLPYPGGPAIAEAARYGNPNRYEFPIPLKGSLDFSFSGLKTAVLRAVQKAVDKPISFPSHELPNLLKEEQVANFAASFQNCAIDVLLDKLDLAIKQYKPRSIVFAGGVSANALLREKAEIKYKDIPVFFPDPKLSGDNGAMVAAAAYYETMSKVPPTDPYSLDISPRSTIK
ncbi:MAG: hypothetical protein Q4E47_02980, partial [Candidatus Saccharibacteria bacterium]|nr:hypothetical protein [Candidatus Saccharibacteria bacterium]